MQKLKLKQIEAFLKHLLRSSIGVLEKYFDLKTYDLKSIWEIEILKLNRWNRKFSMKILNSRLVYIKDFCSSMNKSKSNLIMHKALDWIIKKLSSLKIYNKCSLSLKNLEPPSSSSFKYTKFNSLELQKNKGILIHRYPSYLISLHRVHRREFHITSFCVANSNSDKPSACKKMDEICKSTKVKKTKHCGQSCNEKSNVCNQKKVKCDKLPKENKVEAKQKPKTERKIADPVCNKTCLERGKCEWPHTVPPPKMEYVKVTCPPLKFMKPNLCPSISEHFENDNKFNIEVKKTKFQKKQICAPPPLPKPPFEPIPLCPCPPPRKMHPGSCPCYESKEVHKPILMQPCPLKKKYPCPTNIHYCPLQEKPCNLKQDSDCERKRKKETSAL